MNQTLCPAGCCAFFLASGLHLIAFQNVSSRVMSHDHLSLSLLSFHIWLIIFFSKVQGWHFSVFLGWSLPPLHLAPASACFCVLWYIQVMSCMWRQPSVAHKFTAYYGLLFWHNLLLNACTDVGSIHLRKTTQTRINLLASGVSLQDGSGIPPIGAEWPWSLRHYALSHMTSLRNKRIEPGCQAWWEEPFPTPTGPQALWATARALTGFPAPSALGALRTLRALLGALGFQVSWSGSTRGHDTWTDEKVQISQLFRQDWNTNEFPWKYCAFLPLRSWFSNITSCLLLLRSWLRSCCYDLGFPT